MNGDASFAPPRWSRFLHEGPAILPVIAVTALLAWLALAEATGPAEAGPSSTATVSNESKAPELAAVGLSTFLVTFEVETAAELTLLLEAESRLRGLLGEQLRESELVQAADEADAERIATALRDDFGRFYFPHAAIVVR